MNPAGLSLLTYPTLPRCEYPKQWIKRIAKLGFAAARLDAEALRQLSQGGHPAVTRSAIAGCRALGLPYNLNPGRPSDLYPWVLVLSSVFALKQAIRWRTEGRIEHLWAGPNLVVLPTEAGGILAHPLIDRVVVPSRWVAEQYVQLMPALQGRVLVWPAGVSVDQPSTASASDQPRVPGMLRVLHYNKLSATPSESRWLWLYEQVRGSLAARHWPQSELVYGCHQHRDYYRRLRQSDVMLYWTDAGESQGMALLEAWAMNVPTLVVANARASILGIDMVVSSAPYLSSACGYFFRSAQELMALLDTMASASVRTGFEPRQWVKHNMTDRLSMQRLVELFVRSESCDSLMPG